MAFYMDCTDAYPDQIVSEYYLGPSCSHSHDTDLLYLDLKSNGRKVTFLAFQIVNKPQSNSKKKNKVAICVFVKIDICINTTNGKK